MTKTATQQEREDTTQQRSWLDARTAGRTVRSWIAIGVAIAVVTLGFGAFWTYGLDRGGPMAANEQMASQDMSGQVGGAQMGDGSMSIDAPRVPPVLGYYDGEHIAFIHTEASDPVIAQVLQGMMGSPVLVVTSLADVPDPVRGTVYVFANGVVPEDTPVGPIGFQPDVFDSAPGDDYTPLREVVEVTWNDDAQAELLTSAAEIQAAEADGRLNLEDTGVVVNTPFLTWPGGQR